MRQGFNLIWIVLAVVVLAALLTAAEQGLRKPIKEPTEEVIAVYYGQRCVHLKKGEKAIIVKYK